MDAIFDTIRKIGLRRGPSRILGGIGGGIADQTGVSVGLVRILLLLLGLLPVLGWGVYLVAWVLLPWQDGSIPLERFIRQLTNSRSQ
ncbi:PspC domain-containing protein [Occultella aeris]|uniref:PspC domain protein n=1 Tax=Occultella aeris TaxID=2761496 RepID=A0A7M4DQ13_9MICO|nr:PspC domain-containing protein [Occultella aeris]VZO39557.1 PspC domain protein [Occultella aeris]